MAFSLTQGGSVKNVANGWKVRMWEFAKEMLGIRVANTKKIETDF